MLGKILRVQLCIATEANTVIIIRKFQLDESTAYLSMANKSQMRMMIE